jgi:hypothetical protein
MINFVISPKGGVGKSMFSFTLIDYFSNSQGIDLHVIDTDESNPDVYRSCVGKIEKLQALDISERAGMQKLAEHAEKNPGATIVINGRASNDKMIKSYFDILIETIEELGDHKIVMWWVVNEEADSVVQLSQFLEEFGNKKIAINVVVNAGFGDLGQYKFFGSNTEKLILERGGHVVKMLFIDQSLRTQIYSDDKSIKDLRENGITFDKVTMRKYMREMSAQLNKALGL